MKAIFDQRRAGFERRVRVAIGVVLVAILSACGGGGGGSPTPPSIANLSYSPQAVPVTGDSTFTVSGSITFSDSGGDLATLTLRITDATGATVSSASSPIQGISGQTSGTIVGSVLAARPGVGAYTIHVSVSDQAGATSNELSGPFDVVAVASQGRLVAATGPGPASLQVANGKVYWSETGTSALRSVATTGGTVADLATRVVQIQAFAFAGSDLIWEDDRPVSGFGACGTDTRQRFIHRTSSVGVTTVLASGSACAGGTSDIAVDATSVYWVSSTVSPNTYTLNATPLSGGPTTTVTTGFTPIVALVTGGTSALFWMESAYPDPGVIRRRATATGTIDTVASFASSAANTFAVDANNVYYTTANFPRTPSPTETLVAQPLAGGSALMLSSAILAPTKLVAATGQLAWIDDIGLNTIFTAGGSIAQLASFAPNKALDLMVNGSNLLWTETTGANHGETGTVKSVALAGGSPAVLVQGGDAPRRLALDSQSQIHWSEGGAVGLAEGFSRVAALKNGSAQTVLSGISTQAPPFAVSATDVLIADLWRIKRVPLSGGMAVTVAAEDGPIAGVTADNAWAYWNRQDRLSARKAPIGGGAVTVLADQGASLPWSSSPIRLGANGNLYWVTSSNAFVSVPAAGGSLSVVAQNASRCFVLDADNAYFIATSGSISKQPLSGAAPTELATAVPCTSSASGPAGLSPFVLDSQYLYWIGPLGSLVTDTVSKVSVSGGRVVPVLAFDGVIGTNGASIAVDATSVYWAQPTAPEIRASAK